MTPEPARANDLEAVVDLVQRATLPTTGIADAFPDGYSVLRRSEQIIGVAGLETHGDVGLLRSVAVAASEQGQGLGRLLVEERLARATARKLRAVYLLTTTAAGFFRGLGFEDSSRGAAPGELQGSSEFSTVCPATAVCLVKRLSS